MPRDATRRPAYLYRVYDTQRRLIYIGSTVDLWSRLGRHRLYSWWAYAVGQVRAEVHPVQDVRRIERRAIIVEKPRWNRHGLQGRSLLLPQDQFFDFVYGRVATLLADPGSMRDHHRDWLAQYRSTYERRFGVPLNIDFDTLDIYADPVPTFETSLVTS